MSTSSSFQETSKQNEKIKCDYGSGDCSTLFNRREDMDRHKSEKHGDPKKCPWCGYSAKRDQRLWNHLYEEHEARSYRQRKCRCDKKSKYSAKQQSHHIGEQSQAVDAQSSLLESAQGDPDFIVRPSSRHRNEDIAGTEVQSMYLLTEQENNAHEGQHVAQRFIQPSFIQPTSVPESHQQNQAWGSSANTPLGSIEDQYTFGYIPIGQVSHGVGTDSHPQRPSLASNQTPVTQVGFSLATDHQFYAPTPLVHDKQQQSPQSAWVSSLNPSPEYAQSTVNPTYLVAPEQFNQAGADASSIPESTMPRPVLGLASDTVDTWRTPISSSPTFDFFTNSATAYFSGDAEHEKDPSYLDEFGNWEIDGKRAA